MFSPSLRMMLCASTVAFAAACAGPDEEVIVDELDEMPVEEGKEDNFVSVSAAEFFVSGPVRLTLESEYSSKTAAQKLARAKQLAALKALQVSWFLNGYLIKKDEDHGGSNYGGYGAIARFGSEETGTPKVVEGLTYEFQWRTQVAGKKTLPSLIPGTTVSGGRQFKLAVGRVSNSDLARLEINREWYRDAPWSDFDPSTAAAGSFDELTLTMKAQKASPDGWLAYDRLFSDGEVTIALHTGHDYHARYDIQSARKVYEWLTANGFRSPVASFKAYLRTSGPLTKTIKSNGKNIVAKVWIFHPGDAANGFPGPDPDTDAGGRQLEDDMRQSFKDREVIMFLGHSGPLYGFALANWKKTDEGDLDDSEVASLDMPRDRYQIVLANGCDTYAIGQQFWANPNKADKKNLNIITTTSFSNAATEKSAVRLLQALVNQTNGKVAASKVSELAQGFDADQGYYFDSMFGIHGSDANPRYHPMSDPTKLCRTCTSDAACGADGNRCTKISSTARVCSFECVDTTGCPSGYSCKAIASAGTITTKQCVPTRNKCQ